MRQGIQSTLVLYCLLAGLVLTGEGLYVTLPKSDAPKVSYSLASAFNARDSTAPDLMNIYSTVIDINEGHSITLPQVEAHKAQVETLDLAYDSRKTNQLIREMDPRLVKLESYYLSPAKSDGIPPVIMFLE